MPCPPSYEEQRFMQLDNELAVIEKKYKSQIDEYPSVKDVIGLIVKNHYAQINETYLARQTELFTKSLKLFTQKYDYPKTWPTYDDVQQYQDYVTSFAEVSIYNESLLCDLRTLLISIVNTIDMLTNDEIELYEIQKSIQLKHRKEDLKSYIQMQEMYIRINSENEALVKKYKDNIQIAKSLSDEELLLKEKLF